MSDTAPTVQSTAIEGPVPGGINPGGPIKYPPGFPTLQDVFPQNSTTPTTLSPPVQLPGSDISSPPPQTSAAAGSSGMTYSQVENTWVQAGGNPQAASMAAAIADAESGLNPNSNRTNPDGTTSIGLWLIPKNGTPPGSTDPIANARAAIQLSNNGTDWTQWCSAWSDNNCGCNNGTYLGSGANALMSLQSQLGTGSYQMFGSTPAGTGVGASSAAGTTTSGTGGTSSRTFMLIGLLVVVIAAIVFWSRRRAQTQPT